MSDTTNTNEAWWEAEPEAVHSSIFALSKALEQQQQFRSLDNLTFLRLYLNQDVSGWAMRQYTRSIRPDRPDRLSLNAIESCIDTQVSKIGKNRPRPMFVTDGGKWSDQQRAKSLNKFTYGAFLEADVYAHTLMALRDSGIFGTGCVKTFSEAGRVRVMRIIPENLLVDDGEALFGQPKALMEKRQVSRRVLHALFKDADDYEDGLAGIIDAAGKDSTIIVDGPRTDMVQVREAWHLPSVEGGNDGRHVIAVDSGTLLDEPWERKTFPFAFVHYKKRPLGFWGKGLAEELQPIQLELNRTAQKIQAILALHTSRTFIRRQARIPKAHVDNAAGAIIEVDDPTDLKTVADNAVPPEFFRHLDWLWAKAFEKSGISMLSAASKKPSGLDAAVALREMNDIESDRFYTLGQAYEQIHVDIGNLMLDEVRALAEETDEKDKPKGYKVKLPEKRRVEELDWKDIEIARDEYVLKVFPASALPTTPGARLSTVQELIQAGYVSQEEGRKLLDFPDLEQSNSLATAAIDDVDATIEAALERGEFMAPEPYQNLDLLVKRGTAAYLKARHDGAPEDKLAVLRDLIDDAANMLKPPPAPPPPAPPMPADPNAMPPPMPGAPIQ